MRISSHRSLSSSNMADTRLRLSSGPTQSKRRLRINVYGVNKTVSERKPQSLSRHFCGSFRLEERARMLADNRKAKENILNIGFISSYGIAQRSQISGPRAIRSGPNLILNIYI
ncbi:hypothetical protein CHARACLAT_007038 [Characodon lateralis]|uniref:Uncharacterized protein n=1 Tax=Characodon lateralis TaxID=208331 RepID=A0ABU7EIH1_9TELE|nr:hypothetical protein [Characodon lateralis]